MKFHYWKREVFRAGTTDMMFRGIGVSFGPEWFIGIGHWTLEKNKQESPA